MKMIRMRCLAIAAILLVLSLVSMTQAYAAMTTVGDGVSPASRSVNPGEDNRTVSAFTISTDSGTDTVNTIVVRRGGTGDETDIATDGVRIYLDNNNDNEWDTDDLPKGIASFSGTDATFISLGISVSTTPVTYLITYDIAAGATVDKTLTGYILSATATNPVTNNDNEDATLTVSAGCITSAPTVSITPSAQTVATNGGSADYTVTVRNNDSAVCSATTFSISVGGDSNSTDFTTPSILMPVSLSLMPGATGTSLLTVSAKAAAPEGTQNITDVEVSAPGHTSPAPVTVTTTVVNPLLHNSLTIGSSKWGINGWGIAGGKYGAFVCGTCHTRATGNIKRIKESITAPNDPVDTFPGSSVTFMDAREGTSDFGDDSDGHSTSIKICEVCHSQNKYHNYNTANNTGGLDHNNYTDCAACHLHSEGFKASCSACHGDPPPPLAGQGGSTPTGSVEPGAHVFHATTQGYACATCHQNSVGTGATHNNTIISIGFNIFSGAYASGSYDGQLSANYQATNAGTTVSMNGNLTCSAIYCHGSTMAPNGGTDTTPEWNNPATAVCGTCHGVTAANPPKRGMHLKHAGEWSGGGPVFWGRELACSLCHKDPAVDKSLHVNNMSEVLFSADPRVAGGIYSGTPAMLDAYGNCSGVYCHSNVQTSPPGGPVTYVSVNWGDSQSFSCNVCHQGPATHTIKPKSGNMTGSHVKHASYNRFGCVTCHTNDVAFDPTDPVNGGLDCDGCHAATDVNTSHTNYSIDVAFVNIYGGSYSGNPMPGDPYGNCSSTYCHSTGVSVRTDSVPANTTPNWGSGPLACNACHGNTMYPSPNDGMPNYANGTPKENSHLAHVINNNISCQNCHNGTTTNGTTIASTALHVNKKYDAQASGTFAGQPIAFTYVPASTGSPGSCSSISCHGDNSATWGGDPLKCSDCHFGASDTDDFTYGNGITARISSTEWSYSGHGKTSGTYDVSMNPAANLPGAAGTGDPCLYCHSTTVGHNVMTNPFRLANNNIGGNGWNDTCLSCHRTGSAGYDPDGAGPMASKNATKKINKYHYGAKHGPSNYGGSLCIDCHEPHGDRNAGGGNIFMIHRAVTKDKIDEYGRPAATASPVFTANTTGSDYAKTASPFNGICNVCHTQTAYHRNNATGDHSHNIGLKCIDCHAHSGNTTVDGGAFAHGGGSTNCIECHGHDAGTLYDPDMSVPYTPGSVASPGNGTFKSHSTHTELDSDDMRGPGIYCNTCHDINNYPYFNSGTDTSGDGKIDLSETDVCESCHSPAGAFNGVNSSGSSIGAKDNWANGVYTGSSLTAGKEKWCVGCHDQGTSLISGVQAPDIAGNDAQDYGFYVVSGGHGDPSLSAVTECGACHDLTKAHIDGDEQTYPSQSYKAGYRLQDVGGNDPMNIPYLQPTPCVYNQGPTDFELCFSCHSEETLLNDTKSYGRYCNINPYEEAASITTTFKDVDGTADWNIHADHLIGISGWQFIPPFPTAKWDSDGDATPDSAITCITCHNPHGVSRNGSDTPTMKMTVADLDILHGSDATGDYGLVGPDGNVGNVCFSCHSDNGGKYYYSAVPNLSSITLADNNNSDPTAAETNYTNNQNITVTLFGAGEPTEMICAQDAGFSVNIQPDSGGDGWGPYASPFTYPISGGDGGYTIFCKTRNARGESGPRSKTITLDTTDPTVGVNAVTLPNGSEVWDQGSSYNITWSGVSDTNIKAAPIDLDYSTDSGGSYTNSIATNELNDGTYLWNPIPLIVSSTVRVRLTATDRAGNQNSDESNADFTIQAVTPTISTFTVTDSNNSDPVAAEAGFTNGRTVDVAISANNFPDDMIMAEDFSFSQNSTGWIPYNTSTTYTLSDSDAVKTVWLKLRNESGESISSSYVIELDRGVPNVNADDLIAPNGAEIWEEGETSRQITWASGDVTDSEGNLKASPIDLDYSTDGGSSYPYNIAANEINDGSYVWNPIPKPASYRTRVRITVTDKAGNQASDISDADFLIKPQDDLIVTLADDSDDALCGGGFDCSLREAIYNAGIDDTIWFNIPSGLLTDGVAVINILTPLPDIAWSGIVIDGGSQAILQGDSNPIGPEIRIDGTYGFDGLNITADNVTIRGLQVTNFYTYGINISGGDNSVLEGNHIGFWSDDNTGYTKRGNYYGMRIVGSGCRIGGDGDEDRNFFSGNTRDGMYVATAPNVVIQNNYIGLLPDGADMSNGLSYDGIGISLAPNGLIKDNMISGSSEGIYVGDTNTLTITGNIFGYYFDGTSWNDRTQQNYAIRINSSSARNITIGGPNVATDDNNLNDSNVFSVKSSGSGGVGSAISVYHNNASPTKIYGNFFGTNPEQDESFPGKYGVYLTGFWGSYTVIGGSGVGEASNVIANMADNGVYVVTGANYVKISRNSFFNNGSEAALSDDAIYLDGTANNSITRPTITAANTSTVTVGGVASGDTVEVYISDYDGAGTEYGEGMTFVGSAVSGGASVDVPVSAVNVGDWVTAIRIQADLDTSPFSSNFQVP